MATNAEEQMRVDEPSTKNTETSQDAKASEPPKEDLKESSNASEPPKVGDSKVSKESSKADAPEKQEDSELEHEGANWKRTKEWKPDRKGWSEKSGQQPENTWKDSGLSKVANAKLNKAVRDLSKPAHCKRLCYLLPDRAKRELPQLGGWSPTLPTLDW